MKKRTLEIKSPSQGKKSKKQNPEKPFIFSENELLLREAQKIVEALGKMLFPCCEVVLHDLTNPNNSIIAIECPLSGRKVGDPATEMGLARIKDPLFPEVVQNYTNTLPNGRSVKSTSIGIKNSEGKFIAAICLNLDISLFSPIKQVLELLTSTTSSAIPETLQTRSTNDVRAAIESFAAQHNAQPRTLSLQQRHDLLDHLVQKGLLQLRNAIPITAETIGISRASVYGILKKRDSFKG